MKLEEVKLPKKPAFPFKVTREYKDGKLVKMEPSMDSLSDEQKKQVKGYSKLAAVYKKEIINTARSYLPRLVERVINSATLITKLKTENVDMKKKLTAGVSAQKRVARQIEKARRDEEDAKKRRETLEKQMS